MGEVADGETVVKRHPEAVSEAREFVRLEVGRMDLDDYAPCLVASELVTNALRHTADDEVILRLGRTGDGHVWLEVQDTGPEQPRMREAKPTDESGRGLFVVDQLSRCWGVRPLAGGGGKVVFAVIAP